MEKVHKLLNSEANSYTSVLIDEVDVHISQIQIGRSFQPKKGYLQSISKQMGPIARSITDGTHVLSAGKDQVVPVTTMVTLDSRSCEMWVRMICIAGLK